MLTKNQKYNTHQKYNTNQKITHKSSSKVHTVETYSWMSHNDAQNRCQANRHSHNRDFTTYFLIAVYLKKKE